MRKKTKKIYVGDVAVGGNSPISVQSMTTAKTSDVDAVVEPVSYTHLTLPTNVP